MPVSKFRKFHNLDPNADLSELESSIISVNEAVEITNNFLTKTNPKSDGVHFQKLTHINLIARINEHVNGMLCCLATNNPTGSEVLSRVVLEGSINLIYLSLMGDEKVILSYFDLWLNGHKRKLSDWTNEIHGKPYEKKVAAQITERMKVVDIFNNYIQTGCDTYGIDRESNKTMWPKSFFKRCEILNMKEIYYQNYHRLSGSSHMTPEDTISWLMTIVCSENERFDLGMEALFYSHMMSRFSCYHFVCALFACCTSHGLKDESMTSRFEVIRDSLVDSAMEIASKAGVPHPG